MKREMKILEKSKEQRAKGEEQGAKSKGRRAKDSSAKNNFSTLSFAPEKSGQAVDFSQRINKDSTVFQIIKPSAIGTFFLRKAVFPNPGQLGLA
jgi:hypothetical protein